MTQPDKRSEPELLREFLTELREWSSTTSKLRNEISLLRQNIEPIIRSYQGEGAQESIPTRLKILEIDIKKLEDSFNKQNYAEVEKEILNLRNDINKIKEEGDDRDSKLSDVDKFIEDSKSSWRKYTMKLLEWIGAIASAYVIFRLTGGS